MGSSCLGLTSSCPGSGPVGAGTQDSYHSAWCLRSNACSTFERRGRNLFEIWRACPWVIAWFRYFEVHDHFTMCTPAKPRFPVGFPAGFPGFPAGFPGFPAGFPVGFGRFPGRFRQVSGRFPFVHAGETRRFPLPLAGSLGVL